MAFANSRCRLLWNTAVKPSTRSDQAQVSEGNDSDDGVTQAIALIPDFIVLDFNLDGETTTRLKGHISTRGIPVIALARMADVRTRGPAS